MSRDYFSKLFIVFLFQLLICPIASAEDFSGNMQNFKKFEISDSQILLSFKYYGFYQNLNFNHSILKNYNQNQCEETSEKSAWLAFGLSYLFPGLGQLYNGEYLKAILFPTFFCLGVAMMVYSSPGADFEGQKPSSLIYVGIGVAGGTYLWNLIDAPVSANRINEERKRQVGVKIISSQDENFVLSINSGHFLNVYKLQLTIRF